jgi:hypothetical protein
MSPARFRWGILLITIGVLLLLNNIGELDWWVWNDIFSLWPLILIAIGLEKIFTKSKVEFIAYLPILGLAAVVFWVAFDGYDYDNEYMTRRGSTYRYTIDMESDIEKIEAKFSFDDIDASLDHTGTRLFRARAASGRIIPEVEFDRQGNIGDLEVSTQRKRIPDLIRIDRWGRDDDWDLYLSDQIPVSLKCYGDASDMDLDCRELLLKDLYVQSDRGDIRIKLGSLNDLVKVKLDGPGADFRLSVPKGCGLKVIGSGQAINSLFEGEGLIETEGGYQSIGYDTLSPKIEMDLSRNLAQFALDYY